MTDERPGWWPECPYPESIFPGSMDEWVVAVPDDALRTHLSGILGREFWGICERAIWHAMIEHEAEGKESPS